VKVGALRVSCPHVPLRAGGAAEGGSGQAAVAMEGAEGRLRDAYRATLLKLQVGD
jgi:hypothetical protein